MFLPLGDDLQKRTLPVVGIFLIAANALVFVYTNRLFWDTVPHKKVLDESTVMNSGYGKFIERWGLVPKEIPRGQVYAVVSYMFLHGDIFHILGNMIVLWAFVGSLENALGAWRFLGLYFLWGILAGITHAAMHWGSTMPLIGASGAIAGMIGAYFVTFGALTRIRTLVWLFTPMKFDIPAGVFVAIWFCSQLSGLANDIEMGQSGIAWYCHLGGFAAGACTMRLFRRGIKARLVRGKGGELILTEPAPVLALAGAPGQLPCVAVDVPPPVPASCPHCGAALEESITVCEKLLRCPAPGCQRLIYLG